MKRIRIAAVTIVFLALAMACAREVAMDSDDVYARALAAWVRTNYGPDVTPTDSGAYILQYDQGTGRAVKDSSFVYVHYTIKDLDGNILSTNREDLSRQLGTYSATDDYGSDIWFVGGGAISKGVEQVLRTMKVGGSATLALPVSLLSTSFSIYNAFSSAVRDNEIFEFVIDDIADDMIEYQDERLLEFRDKYYPGADTLVAGLYYQHLSETEGCDTILNEALLNVRYVGKRLDGTVFDTNIADSAKFYRIYSPSASYKALQVTYYKELSTFLENSGTVMGFTYALSQMKYGDSAVAFFSSDYGYSASGSGTAVGEYCPLFFYIYIEPKQ